MTHWLVNETGLTLQFKRRKKELDSAATALEADDAAFIVDHTRRFFGGIDRAA